MNKIMLNTISLDDGRIIKKGGSGGGGGNTPGGGEEDYNDGKTRLWLVGAYGPIMLNFSQSVANGVTVDWGDGTSETFSGASVTAQHQYNTLGDRIISLDVGDGCTLTLGRNSGYFLLGGSTDWDGTLTVNQMLQKVHVGKGVNKLTAYCLGSLSYNLELVVSGQVKEIVGDSSSGWGIIKGGKLTLMEGVEILNASALRSCCITYLQFPSTITNIKGDYVFYKWCGHVLDFSRHNTVPSLSSSSAFGSNLDNFKIVVPDALYDTWIAATNWSSRASKIVKASEFNA